MNKEKNGSKTKKQKINSDNNTLFIILVTILFSLFVVPILMKLIFNTVVDCDLLQVVDKENYNSWIGYYGSIIGGALTLIGVWWTLDEGRKQKKNELAIQYKPYLYLSFIQIQETKTKYLFEADKKENTKYYYNSLIPITNNWKLIEDCFCITFNIENKGSGECILNCYDKIKINADFGNLRILSELLKFSILPSKCFKPKDIVERHYIQKGFSASIYKGCNHKIQILFIASKDHPIMLDLNLDIPLEYTDQFKYKRYIADIDITLRINMKNREEPIKVISYGILNTEL